VLTLSMSAGTSGGRAEDEPPEHDHIHHRHPTIMSQTVTMLRDPHDEPSGPASSTSYTRDDERGHRIRQRQRSGVSISRISHRTDKVFTKWSYRWLTYGL